MVTLESITCYICKTNIPYDTQKNAFICPECKKVWKVNKLKPIQNEPIYIPGAKHVMGSQSSKKKGNKEMMKKLSLNMMFNRLFNQN